MTVHLNPEQAEAIDSMTAFLGNKGQNFFLLSGYAGTGKTFCIQQLITRVRGRLIFTAPTNKATKVLRDTITTDSYKPECRTIYSLLGLRLEANGEVKELAVPEDPVELSQYKAVIVDEASMINANLFGFIKQAAEGQKVKFIFMGDSAQLPPVGELRSPIWDCGGTATTLTKVMRHDNQILTLATAIRKVVDHPAPSIKLLSDNADGQGVWRLGGGEFESRLLTAAHTGRFSLAGNAKAIAWRNVTVDGLNARIRNQLFGPAAITTWLPEDRVIITEPAKDLEGNVIATTDDEGVITRVELEYHPTWGEFKVWRISITIDDNRPIILRVLHPESFQRHAERAEELAAAARADRRKWGVFWEFKETFHKLRHAYAITAHRSQGSTYDAAFVDWRDILLNRNRQEAFRCLYVACTRPRRELYLN